jgi:hypothetical protein
MGMWVLCAEEGMVSILDSGYAALILVLSIQEKRMFTYKFLGLHATDAPTPYYYGSLPVKPEPGHTLALESGNRYAVIQVEGEGLVDDGNGSANQKELAWADISRGEKVPTLWLQRLGEEVKASGRSFNYEEVKEYSQKNREMRLSTSA